MAKVKMNGHIWGLVFNWYIFGFSCSKQLYRRLCLSVCLSVCLCLSGPVCVSVMPFYHVPITGSYWNLHQTLILWSYAPFSGWKVKVTRAIQNFYHTYSVAPSLFDRFISYKNTCTTHEVTMCRTSFPGQKVMVTWSEFWLCPFCGFLLIWPNNFICGIHIAHEGMMCRTPFSGWKSKVTVTWVVWSFYHQVLSAL